MVLLSFIKDQNCEVLERTELLSYFTYRRCQQLDCVASKDGTVGQ
jgi:hypothetical protein